MPTATYRAQTPRQRASQLAGARPQGDPATLAADVNLDAWILSSKPVTAAFANIITGGSVKSTIEGASTLTLKFADPDRWLLRSRLITEPVELHALDLDWSLAAVSYDTSDNTGELVFEDLLVAELRRRNKPRKVGRDQVTRAQFIKMLVDELPRDIRPIFVCPELKERQPIGRDQDRPSRSARDADRGRGIAKGANLRFRDAPATPPQLATAELHMDVADSYGAPEVVLLALAMIGINETAFRNLPGSSDGLSRGTMQLLNEQAAKAGINNMNEVAVIRYFLLHGSAIDQGALDYAKEHPDATPAQIAQAVWGGQGFPLSTWTRWAAEASALVDAYGGPSVGTARGDEVKRYEFSRGRPGGPKGEDSWDCAGRLAEEVGWRRFIVRERFYYMAEEDLLRSRPRATIRENTAGVDGLQFDIDGRMKTDELTIACRAKLWKAPPGSVIAIDEDDFGPAGGRWLVAEIEREDLFGLDTRIECRRGNALLKEKPEPAPETVVRLRGGGSPAGSGRESKARAIYQAAKRISDQRRPYVYGGGHGPALSSLVGSSSGLDCSSSTSLAVWMAGVMEGDVAQVSGWFASSYGEPGEGEFVTIWAHGGHVYVEGNLSDIGYWRFDTSQNGSSGPRLVTTERSHSGFTARHPS